MPLLNPDTPEDRMSFLDEASAYFLRAIKQHYTRDTAVDVMEALTPILGKDWKGRVIFGIMSNKHTNIRQIRIKQVGQYGNKKIPAIKEVRQISGMGLVEAKNAVEQSEHIATTIAVEPMPADYDQIEWDRRIQRSMEVLRDAGYSVEFI